MKDILYNPNLKYEKRYFTKEKFNENLKEKEKKNKAFLTRKENIENTLNRLKNNIDYIPDEIANVYLPAFIVMNEEYKNIVNNNKIDEEPKPEPKPKPIPGEVEPIIIPDKQEDDDDKVPPPLFYREDDKYIETDDPWANPVHVYEVNFLYNFIDIYEDYIKNLDNIVNDYIVTTLNSVSISTNLEGQGNYTTKEILNTDLHHLSDFLTKSNIMIEQKLRLHKKLFQLDEIILHIKKIRISKQELLRYAKENELKQKDFLDVDSNVLLKESRRVSEKKYENSLYNLYKYLNSSVILMKEALNLSLKQNKSIMTINRYR